MSVCSPCLRRWRWNSQSCCDPQREVTSMWTHFKSQHSCSWLWKRASRTYGPATVVCSHNTPSHPVALKKLMQLPGGLDLITTPCPSTPTSPRQLGARAVDTGPTVDCCSSLSSLSLSLSQYPHSLHPPTSPTLFVRGKRESCQVPEADCSSLNNSS